jgi:hypothetical protein
LIVGRTRRSVPDFYVEARLTTRLEIFNVL